MPVLPERIVSRSCPIRLLPGIWGLEFLRQGQLGPQCTFDGRPLPAAAMVALSPSGVRKGKAVQGVAVANLLGTLEGSKLGGLRGGYFNNFAGLLEYSSFASSSDPSLASYSSDSG